MLGCQETNWRGLPSRNLFLAVQEGDVEELRLLLQDPEMKNRVNDLDNDRMGLLHIFALNGEDYDAYDIIQELKDAGVDIDAKSPMTQETPLQFATVHRREKVVKALLDHGARTGICDWKGDSSVPTAEKKCAHNGNGNEKCCRVLKLLLAAKQKFEDNVEVQGQADLLRKKGNEAFMRRRFEEATELYSQSLDVREDHRTYANRSLCSIEIARKILIDVNNLKKYPKEIHIFGRKACSDARKAIAMDRTFVKAHYRQTLGYLLCREFTRAKYCLKQSLQEDCSNNKQLIKLYERLDDDFNVPDFCHSDYTDQMSKEAHRKKRAGEDWISCYYCWGPNIEPVEESCVHCAMPLGYADESKLRAFILEA